MMPIGNRSGALARIRNPELVGRGSPAIRSRVVASGSGGSQIGCVARCCRRNWSMIVLRTVGPVVFVLVRACAGMSSSASARVTR